MSLSTNLYQRHRYREVKPQISADFYQLKICVGRQDFVNTISFEKNTHTYFKVEYIESNNTTSKEWIDCHHYSFIKLEFKCKMLLHF